MMAEKKDNTTTHISPVYPYLKSNEVLQKLFHSVSADFDVCKPTFAQKSPACDNGVKMCWYYWKSVGKAYKGWFLHTGFSDFKSKISLLKFAPPNRDVVKVSRNIHRSD